MADTQSANKRHRSPPYPAFNLREALGQMRRFHDVAKRNALHTDVAMKELGYSPTSSNAKRAIATLLSFGLLEEEGNGDARRVKLTQPAYNLVHLHENDLDRAEIIKQLALKPKIYAEMVAKWPLGLPPDAEIEKYLKITRNFNPEVVRPLIGDFKATYEFANLADGGILSDEESDSEVINHGDQTGERSTQHGRNGVAQEGASSSTGQGSQGGRHMTPSHTAQQGESNARTYTLPILDGRTAVLHAPPDISAEDFDLLTMGLEVIKMSLERRTKSGNADRSASDQSEGEK